MYIYINVYFYGHFGFCCVLFSLLKFDVIESVCQASMQSKVCMTHVHIHMHMYINMYILTVNEMTFMNFIFNV